jgi:hypothetical protein
MRFEVLDAKNTKPEAALSYSTYSPTTRRQVPEYYEGESVKRKTYDIRTWNKTFLFLDISSTNIGVHPNGRSDKNTELSRFCSAFL